ncbi:MAG TPA: serine/threonine protein kinase, partial [Planctomycetes bacterium]|nr:serine/threonine protein kinase [Planctomycetota bacterium]
MQIGPYQLEGELGRGGMGVVYAATDLRSGAKVALKLLLSTREATPAARRRQEIELQTLSRLPPHPHLVRLLDAGAHQGAHYTVSELVAGDTLEDRLRAGPLPVADALRLARELAQALIAVHAQGVLHRDLKPDNVLLRASDGAALLTDFGLALDLEATYTRVTRSHALMGTPGYWAPEQALGETRAVGPATDVYGLGA